MTATPERPFADASLASIRERIHSLMNAGLDRTITFRLLCEEEDRRCYESDDPGAWYSRTRRAADFYYGD